MRKVLGSHAQTAHVWAQNTQSEGRASDGRMFFERGVIYSYGHHFAIASHVKDLKGDDAVLFTTRRNSVSTSKHIGLVRQALRGNARVYNVPCVSHGMEEENLIRLDKEVKNLLENYGKPRIRHTTRDGIASSIARTITTRNEYGAAFVKNYKPIAVPEDIHALAKSIQEANEKRAKAEAKAKAKAWEAALREAEDALKIPRAEWANMWRKNSDSPLHDPRWSRTCAAYVRETHGVLMRLKSIQEIETSQGAEFPVSHAKLAYALIKPLVATGTEWKKNGHRIPLGHFEIDSIDKAGNIKAGCHTVKWQEVVLMAQRLGLEGA